MMIVMRLNNKPQGVIYTSDTIYPGRFMHVNYRMKRIRQALTPIHRLNPSE